MSSVAFAVSCASSLTSLATTAKPLPASPARAASIVAFRASRFVCSAMLVITLTTLPISAEDSPSFATVAVVVSAAVTARAATSLASAAFDAISRIDAPISSAPAATVCTLRETSSAALETTPDCAAVSSADAEICADDADSSSDDAATASAESTTPAMTSPQARQGGVQGLAHPAQLVPGGQPAVRVRSPAASASATSCTRRTPRAIRRATATPMTTATRMPIASSAIDTVRCDS